MNSVEVMLKKMKKQLCDQLEIITRLSETDYIHDGESFNDLVESLRIRCENLTSYVRNFAINTYTASQCDVYDCAAKIHGIEIRKDGKMIIIDLPCLLPRKKDKQANFIGELLRYRFEKICEEADLKIRSKAVVCIVHMYDNVNRKAKCYDYDNLETKRILDIVTLYTMTDDSPDYCDIYQTSEFGNVDKTRIIVMPIEEFWRLKIPCK